MIFQIKKEQIKTNLRDVLRKCNYFGLQDRNSGQISYVRRLSKTQHYPRFHLYLDEKKDYFTFKLHLDQKQLSYRGSAAHSGEYQDTLVAEEVKRIKLIMSNQPACSLREASRSPTCQSHFGDGTQAGNK